MNRQCVRVRECAHSCVMGQLAERGQGMEGGWEVQTQQMSRRKVGSRVSETQEQMQDS